MNGVEQVAGHLTEVGLRESGLFVQPNEQVRTFILHHGIVNTCDNIYRPARARLELHVRRRSNACGKIKVFEALLSLLFIVVKHDV